MPTYDYRCKACDHAFEKYQPITSKAIRKCPSCGASKVVRLLGRGSGVIFKGSGFYQTDYRSEAYKKAAAADIQKASPAGDGKTSTSDSKSDKPAAKKQADSKPSESKPKD